MAKITYGEIDDLLLVHGFEDKDEDRRGFIEAMLERVNCDYLAIDEFCDSTPRPITEMQCFLKNSRLCGKDAFVQAFIALLNKKGNNELTYEAHTETENTAIVFCKVLGGVCSYLLQFDTKVSVEQLTVSIHVGAMVDKHVKQKFKDMVVDPDPILLDKAKAMALSLNTPLEELS